MKSRFVAISRDASGSVKIRFFDALMASAPPDSDKAEYLWGTLPGILKYSAIDTEGVAIAVVDFDTGRFMFFRNGEEVKGGLH